MKMLSFQTLYIGISPHDGPYIYTIIPMIETVYGVWYIFKVGCTLWLHQWQDFLKN